MTQARENMLTLNSCVVAALEQWNKTTRRYVGREVSQQRMDVLAQPSCEVVSLGTRNKRQGML